MSQTTHHVRTIMTVEGNMRRELTHIEGQLHRTKTAQTHWENGVKTTTRNVTTLGNKTGGLSKSLNGAAMRFMGITMAIGIASMAFRKLNQWVDASVEQFRAFDNSMAEVSTILTGETFAAIETLTVGVKQLSVQYGQSAVDMSRGLYQILSAAVDVEKSLNLLNTATKASIAGLTSVETSVDVLTSIINSYGKSVEQAAGVSDILFQTVVRGKLRFEDLASSLGYITPIAAAAGVAFEEIAAALATVTRMGLHVDMASRGLALTIQNVVSPTKQAKDAANEFGVDMSAVGIRVFGLKGFITDLSEAVKEFGLAVLPRMVRNMRSLRVVMALASEEGLKGFAEDLNLVYASAGRTDEALAKMIKTQQRQAAIVKESMAVIERSVGEVWSPIKLNIEATKLWFTTWVAGGLNFGAANREIEKLSGTIEKNRQRMYDSISTMGKMGQQPIFTQLFNMEDYEPAKIDAAIKSMVDTGDVLKYLNAQQMTLKKGARGGNIFEDTVAQLEMLKKSIAYGSITAQSGTFKRVMEDAAEMFDIGEYKKGVNVFGYLDDAIAEVNATAEDNIGIMNDNVDAFNTFFSTLDTAREQVFNFKTNILELKNAITGLSVEVADVFTDLSGTEHAGTLGMEIDVKSFDTAMDRMGKFSSMIKEHGTEWETMFYDIFEGKTYSMGDEEISYIKEYDSELKSAINTVYDFSASQEEVKKTMNEVNKAIQINNLAIAKLQLIGMLRRRGATRAEERAIKKLTIENMKERLKEKEAQVEAMSDIDKVAYEKAQNDIKKYFDSQKFHLYLMKDAREDELTHMIDTFDRKEKLLAHYETALTTQEGYLEKAHQIELDYLLYISEELPNIAVLYEEIYGVSIPESYQKSIDAHLEWIKLQGKSPSTGSSKGSTSTFALTPKEKLAEKKAVIPTLRDVLAVKYPIFRKLPKFSRGTEFITKTGPVIVDRGERIVPAGKRTGDGNTIIENVTINVKEIADIGSVEKVGAALGATGQANVTDTRGKSKYRMR